MNIILVRHGKYKTDDKDEDAGLDDEGIEEIKMLREHLDDDKIAFDVVITSPKIRTRQTAEILCDCCNDFKEISPSLPIDVIYDFIPKTGTVLFVFHNPSLTAIAEKFGEHVTFEPGTMAHFTDDGLKKIFTPS